MKEEDGREVSREVVVTGFGRTDTHELPSCLTWGPDGFLYGLNGVFNHCQISSAGRDYEFNCALYRIDPHTHRFELFCEGTSNPWGLVWDPNGSAIVSTCHWANDHVFHFVETGYYQRQAGAYVIRLAKLFSPKTNRMIIRGNTESSQDSTPLMVRIIGRRIRDSNGLFDC